MFPFYSTSRLPETFPGIRKVPQFLTERFTNSDEILQTTESPAWKAPGVTTDGAHTPQRVWFHSPGIPEWGESPADFDRC